MEEELINFPRLKAVMEQYITALRNKYQDNLIAMDHIASGELLNSVETKVSFKGQDYWVALSLAETWKWVEWDTKPHFPPMDAILKWIKVKPILPHPDENGKLPTPQQLAYLIGRKISEEGTKGSNSMKDAQEWALEEYDSLIMDAIDEDLGNAAIDILKIIYLADAPE